MKINYNNNTGCFRLVKNKSLYKKVNYNKPLLVPEPEPAPEPEPLPSPYQHLYLYKKLKKKL